MAILNYRTWYNDVLYAVLHIRKFFLRSIEICEGFATLWNKQLFIPLKRVEPHSSNRHYGRENERTDYNSFVVWRHKSGMFIKHVLDKIVNGPTESNPRDPNAMETAPVDEL